MLFLPFAIYIHEKRGYYKKSEKMMEDCNNDEEFEKLIKEHEQEINENKKEEKE